MTSKKNSYLKNIATLMSGTLAAQIVSLAAIPVITRIYNPTEFGAFSFLLSISTIIGLVSSLKYDQAIMLPKRVLDTEALVKLSFIITSLFTLATLIVIILFGDKINEAIGYNNNIIYFVPLLVFFVGSNQILSASNGKFRAYKTISLARLLNTASSSGVQISSKSLFDFNGLFVGRIVGELISFVIQLSRKSIVNLSINKIVISRMRLNASRYINFPKYQSTTVFINAVSQNLPVILFTALFNPAVAGLFALTVKVLQVPISLVGSSTREVYYQAASKLNSEGKSFFNLYKKTTFNLAKLFIPALIVVLIWGGECFALVFGEEWKEAGNLAKMMIIWFFFLFINSPSIATFSILGLQKIQLKTEIISVIGRALSILIGYYFFTSYEVAISLFILISVSTNLFLISYVFLYLKRNSSNA
ncbi:oligosaccharide flippase family protein [Vibrio sp. J1-1]|uniref:lipopolysaccharide biosynthesis protein n=1 Tax=Vibrio sp. J1-1 TaxID=2912251 RepID=UPI001F196DEC|nr:oligosaccharide flippase family protein [Vibrio sp. J1-1]MCF7482055.1 oligosaccharide flippase family protein [Vibrio sp. J1-1]